MPELGVHLTASGARAAFPAPGAQALELCVFTPGQEARHALPERVGDVFSGAVPLREGARYGLRAHGPGLNPAKLLLDPWARRIDRAFVLHPSLSDASDSAAAMPKAVLEAASAPVAPPVRQGARVIYELHVRGFTRQHPAVPDALRGTFAGLAHPAAIDHLRALGVTDVELLPCAAWIDERHLPPLGLSNRWGYNPVGFLAPDPRLAPGGMAEIRATVAALAEAGIGVILDIVLNHTGESDVLGPTVSLRGLGGDAAWYHQCDGMLLNHAGTGNALALDRPWPMQLAMDALRHWAAQGIAGFRLDLATTLGRRAEGFDAHAAMLLAMRQDPLLRDLLIIAEPWDIGAHGYRLGQFAAGWPEWNDRFRDETRRFWRGDRGLLGAFTTRFAGSADIFAGRPATDSLNYVTAHDGFTLADLVSHAGRHNEANGEANRDGTADSRSWNNGTEGATEDPAILARRAADARALLLLLLTARGTPMLSMGDELGRSQGGNNNAYCQDMAVEWPGDAALAAFTARLVRARRDHPALHAAAHLSGEIGEAGLRDVAWHHPAGGVPDWPGQALLALLSAGTDRVAVAFNAGPDPMKLVLPEARPDHRWRMVADSAAPEATAIPSDLAGRAAVLVVEERRPTSGAPDDALLRLLARSAGIETHRQDAGASAGVPLDSIRAVLAALEVPFHSAAAAHAAMRALAVPPPLPAHPVLTADAPGSLLLGPGFRGDGLEIALDCGPTFALAAEPCWHALPDGSFVRARRAAVPPLPAGHHRLLADGMEATLTVAPARAFLPEGGHFFGLAAQSYALRRPGDQGIGDYTALGLFAAEAAQAGARLLGISPPHALMPVDRERASPYQPSDRRFLEPILIDLADLPGASAALAAEAGLFQALNAGEYVDYSQVWAAKRRVLRAAFTVAPPELDGFIAAGGAALARFATFTVMAEEGSGPAGSPGMAHAADSGVAAFQRQHAEAIRFVQFQQFIADRQLGRAAAAGAGLYRDLAVGSAPDGAEVWCSPDGFMRGFSLGVPPDALGPNGQVWGLPAPRPAAAPAHFAELLAANTRHAAALRIDHVMALQRLFLVPDGASGAAGCYLAYPRDALLAELTLASQRARCLIVGEDLGTVPEGLGEVLAAADLLSYRVLWFQQDAAGMIPPAIWTERAAACVSTHDLPTLAGWWEGADLAERRALGLLEEDGDAGRAEERATLLAALTASGNLPEGATPDSAFSDVLAAAIHAHVAGSASLMMLAQAEDLAGERMAVNLPGTDRERPNWRQRLSVPLPGLTATPRGQAILAAIRGMR